MTIHHDKMAYGKLASSSEELSEEKIAKMLAKLSAGQDSEEGVESEKKGEEDKKDKNKK